MKPLFKPRDPRSVYSEANIITLLRLGGSLVFFVLAVIRQSPAMNFMGLGIHWLGDLADGFCARKARQETILGAEIDIIADRVEVLFFYVNFLHFNPGLWVPTAIYILDFAFIDFYLSYQFTKYDIISPNYYYKVDRKVYNWNFSPAGKFANSTVVTLVLIFLPALWPGAAVFALGLIGVKAYSVRRLFQIGKVKKDKTP